MFNYNKLRGKIVEKYGTLSNFADSIGKAVAWVSAKLNSGTGFSAAEVTTWCKALEIEKSEVGIYFFTEKV